MSRFLVAEFEKWYEEVVPRIDIDSFVQVDLDYFWPGKKPGETFEKSLEVFRALLRMSAAANDGVGVWFVVGLPNRAKVTNRVNLKKLMAKRWSIHNPPGVYLWRRDPGFEVVEEYKKPLDSKYEFDSPVGIYLRSWLWGTGSDAIWYSSVYFRSEPAVVPIRLLNWGI